MGAGLGLLQARRMWYRISMAPSTQADNERLYVDSLRWRRGDLQDRLSTVRSRIESLTEQEAQLKSQLRAIDQLLAVDGGTLENGGDGGVKARQVESVPVDGEAHHSLEVQESSGEKPPFDFSSFGPTARRIYSCAEQILRDAGVPMHYRALAEEIEKSVPLSGADAGATLIAHLHRAQEVFPRVGRGVYGLKGVTPAASGPVNGGTSNSRRPKTRRRTR